MNVSVRVRLSVMMALIYAVQGAWWPMLALHLGDLGLSGRERGWIFARVSARVAVLHVARGGGRALVDRLMPAQRYLSLCYGLGTIFLVAVALGFKAEPSILFGLFLAYWLLTAPTYGISGAIAFRNLPRPDAEFGRIRMWGTVGWMAAGWLVSAAMAHSGASRSGNGAFEAFWIAGTSSAAAGGVRLALAQHAATGPRRPGRATGRNRLVGADTFGRGPPDHVVRRQPDDPARLSGDAALLRVARTAPPLGSDGVDARPVARDRGAGRAALAPPGIAAGCKATLLIG